LRGNTGANDLKGLAGADAFWGGKGNDRLFGGDGGDSFHFSTGDGKDRVMDFDAGIDALHLEGWTTLADLDDLKNHFATDRGNNLVIKAGNDSLTILGIHKADLDATNVFL
jgi:Ca2+-binding RTX toxin-like protein